MIEFLSRYKGALLVGVLYGLFVRICFGVADRRLPGTEMLGGAFVVMSIAFLTIAPFSIGVITVQKAAKDGPLTWKQAVFMPWLPVIICLVGSMILAIEGTICVIFFSPMALALSSIGGLISRKLSSTGSGGAAVHALVPLLPFVVAPIEAMVPSPDRIEVVESSIVVDASPAAVWEEIRSVPPIDPAELPFSWARVMGFPPPIEAQINRDGVGAVRRATFAGNVVFTETVDLWEPPHELAFGIRANTEEIPPTSLDQHVTIGGPYFDVLRGHYSVQQRADGGVLLRLRSDHRLSTHFNWYARLWSRFVMADIQQTILEVIRNRAQGAASGSRPSFASSE